MHQLASFTVAFGFEAVLLLHKAGTLRRTHSSDLLSALQVVKKIEALPTSARDKPSKEVKIAKSGEL